MQGSNVAQRLWFIELIAWWEGKLNAPMVAEQFGITPEQARKDVSHYRQTAPNNLTYCQRRKAFFPNAHFRFHFITGDVHEYLNWVSQQDVLADRQALPFHALSLPPRQVSVEVIRVLITAMRQQRRVDVDYVSLTNPDSEGRNLVPHHFVKTGLRWHLRAYCEKTASYRDFVLSRFRGIPELLDPSPHGAEQDKGWQTQVTLVLKPDPRLSASQREVIAHDYSMNNDQLVLHTRACLAQYLLQELQVNTRQSPVSPEAQQLVLVNIDEIRPWLFDA